MDQEFELLDERLIAEGVHRAVVFGAEYRSSQPTTEAGWDDMF
jgi:hypothetical protein